MSLVTNDMEYDPNNETKEVMIQTIPCHHYQIDQESESMDDEDDRTISRDKTTQHSSSAELRALTQSICLEKN